MHWCQISTDSELYNYEYFSHEDVCRLCWTKNADIEILLKLSENSREICLADVIKDCLHLELHETHLSKICVNCFNEIKRFYFYKTFCQDTDAKFREILEKGFEESKIKNLTSDEIKSEDIDEIYEGIETYFDDNVEYEEPESEKKFKSNSKVRKKYLHKRSPAYCNICCIDLKTIENLSQHNADLHGIENNGTLFKCFGCEKRFKSRKRRLGHEGNFCKGLKDGYKCTICDRYLPKRCMYEFHMREHKHNILTELPEHIFKCSKCIKLFKTKEMLKLHMAEHGKNFVCDICGRVFTRQDYLHKHKLTHTGTKSHQCPHCDFRATQRSSLTMHIRKHTGERPYSCDMCPQRCISSSNLLAHRRRHLGVKKYECSICTKKFGYKKSLEEHISITHLRSESHTCELCGTTYSRVRGLQRHLAAKHGKQAKSKNVEQNLFVQVTEAGGNKIDILKEVEYDLKDGENVLLLKHQDGDVYMV